MTAITLPLRPGRRQDPAQVSVEHTVERTVRVAFLVRVGVMLQVIRRPVDWPPLVGHDTEDEERKSKRRRCLKAAVRQQPMQSDGCSKASEKIKDKEKGDLGPTDRVDP